MYPSEVSLKTWLAQVYTDHSFCLVADMCLRLPWLLVLILPIKLTERIDVALFGHFLQACG